MGVQGLSKRVRIGRRGTPRCREPRLLPCTLNRRIQRLAFLFNMQDTDVVQNVLVGIGDVGVVYLVVPVHQATQFV